MASLHTIGESPSNAQLAYIARVNLVKSAVTRIRIIPRLAVPFARRIAWRKIESSARQVCTPSGGRVRCQLHDHRFLRLTRPSAMSKVREIFQIAIWTAPRIHLLHCGLKVLFDLLQQQVAISSERE